MTPQRGREREMEREKREKGKKENDAAERVTMRDEFVDWLRSGDRAAITLPQSPWDVHGPSLGPACSS